MRYERENIQQMSAYTPGEQPQGAQRVIKLNTNENPYPPIEPVMEAIRSLPAEALRKYPSPAAMQFRKTAADVHGVSHEQVIATNGGDELLRLAISVYCEPHPETKQRRGIGVCEPSYSLYPVLAKAHDTPVTAVPLKADYDIAVDFEEQVIAAGVGLVLIVNPHAPSGRQYAVERLQTMAEKLRGHAVLLIDEAYVDFAERDCLPLVQAQTARQLDNVLLLRTMSKGYSLAGLRFGYGIGHAGLIAAMDKVRDSYNTDALSQAAATAALANRPLAAESWKKVIAQRDRMTRELQQRGWQVFPSQSNFLLAIPGTSSARQIYESLKARDILVRYFDHEGLRDKLRITIGTPEQNDAVLKALDQVTA